MYSEGKRGSNEHHTTGWCSLRPIKRSGSSHYNAHNAKFHSSNERIQFGWPNGIAYLTKWTPNEPWKKMFVWHAIKWNMKMHPSHLFRGRINYDIVPNSGPLHLITWVLWYCSPIFIGRQKCKSFNTFMSYGRIILYNWIPHVIRDYLGLQINDVF